MDKSYQVNQAQYDALNTIENHQQASSIAHQHAYLGQSTGGSALNTVLDYVWLGGKKVGFVGKVGNDESGEAISKILHKYNVFHSKSPPLFGADW